MATTALHHSWDKNRLRKICKKTVENVFKTFQLRRNCKGLILLVANIQISKKTFYIASHDNCKTSYKRKKKQWFRQDIKDEARKSSSDKQKVNFWINGNPFSCLTWLWPSFGSSCFEKKTLDKGFIGSLLVSGPNISICRYPKTPWDSNAHCLNWKIKESKFREDSWVAMKYFLAHETIQCTTGFFWKKISFFIPTRFPKKNVNIVNVSSSLYCIYICRRKHKFVTQLKHIRNNYDAM